MTVDVSGLEVRTPRAVKRITNLVRWYRAFLLKIDGKLLYVTRSGWVWEANDGGEYTIERGHIRDYVPVPRWYKGDKV